MSAKQLWSSLIPTRGSESQEKDKLLDNGTSSSKKTYLDSGYGSISYRPTTPQTGTTPKKHYDTAVSSSTNTRPKTAYVSYGNGTTVIHGKPNVSLLKRDGNISIDEKKSVGNHNLYKKTDSNLKKLESEHNPPELTYVSFSLAKRISSARLSYPNPKTGENGITQQELANLVGGITLSDIKSVESTSTPAVYNSKLIGKICNKLNISASNK